MCREGFGCGLPVKMVGVFCVVQNRSQADSQSVRRLLDEILIHIKSTILDVVCLCLVDYFGGMGCCHQAIPDLPKDRADNRTQSAEAWSAYSSAASSSSSNSKMGMWI